VSIIEMKIDISLEATNIKKKVGVSERKHENIMGIKFDLKIKWHKE
jgi:hypothetical protein